VPCGPITSVRSGNIQPEDQGGVRGKGALNPLERIHLVARLIGGLALDLLLERLTLPAQDSGARGVTFGERRCGE
jgi:hypothetical protein